MERSLCVRWTWTLQCVGRNDAESRLPLLSALYPEDVRYLIAQLETAPATGQLHFQGYLETVKPVRLTALRRLSALSGAHFENSRGTAAQNTDYCTKEESAAVPLLRIKVGHPKATTLQVDDLLLAIQAGTIRTPLELITSLGCSAYMRHGREVRKMLLDYGVPRSSPPTIFSLIGKTGTGKSRYVEAVWPTRYKMIFSNGGSDGSVWFDGYEGQDIIEFSEYNGQLKLTMLLEVLDRYACRVQTKGGTANLLATTFIFTSNTEHKYWYLNEEVERQDALNRRFKEYGTDIKDLQNRECQGCACNKL